MNRKRRARSWGAALAVLTVSYFAKRRLNAQWALYERTGKNDLTLKSASGLIALAIPWDLTLGAFSKRNVLWGDSARRLLQKEDP